MIQQKKDLMQFASFFKDVGKNGATREDLKLKFNLSVVESRIVIKHLMNRRVIHPIGKLVIGKNATLSIYQFCQFDFQPPKREIISVSDALQVLGHDEDYEAVIEPEPAYCPAGSKEKIEILRRRAELGHKLFSKKDCREVMAH